MINIVLAETLMIHFDGKCLLLLRDASDVLHVHVLYLLKKSMISVCDFRMCIRLKKVTCGKKDNHHAFSES